jgi:UDP-N-acetylglucosamine 3-dehydrogenase
MMEEIKVGVIGLGRFSQLHLQSLKHIPNVKLVAVSDFVKEKVDAVKTDWSCNGYTDWQEMLEKESLDVVEVLTPESTHYEPVMKSLQTGCHVFVEKPLSTSSHESKAMIEMAVNQGKHLMVGHVCRFDSRYIQIKESLQNGSLGKIRSMYARRNNAKMYFSLYKRTHPIYILGIHDIDLMHWFTDSYVTEVYAQHTGDQLSEPDLVNAMLKFKNGTIGVIENNWLLPDKAPSFMDVRMEVVCEEGTVHLQDPDQTLTFWKKEELSTPPLFSWSTVYGRPVGALYEELQHFYNCIQENKKSSILIPDDALSAVQVAEAIIQSCHEGIPIKISR